MAIDKFWNLVYCLFVVCSFIFIPNVKSEWLNPKEAVLLLGSFFLISSSFYFLRFREFKNMWVTLILFFVIISFGIAFYVPMIFTDSGGKVLWNVWNYYQTLQVLSGFFLIKILFDYTDSVARWVILTKVLCWMAFIFALYGIFQYFGAEQIFNEEHGWYVKVDKRLGYPENPRMTAFLGNNFFLGNYLSVLSPFCLIFKELRYKIFYIIIWIALILTKSFLAVFVGFIGLVTYLLLTKKFKWIVVVCLLASTFCLFKFNKNHKFFNNNGRTGLIELAVVEWKKNPIWGGGIGSFEKAGYMAGHKRVDNVHNEFVQLLPEGGIILFGLVMGYLITLFKRIIYTSSNILSIGFLSSFIGYLFVCLGGFPLHLASMALIGIFLITFLELHTHLQV